MNAKRARALDVSRDAMGFSLFVSDNKLRVILQRWPVLSEIMRCYAWNVRYEVVVTGGFGLLLKQLPTSIPVGWSLFYKSGALDFDSAFIISD